MKFKKIILITLLLLAIFTITSVSATDNNATNEVINIENNDETIDIDEKSSVITTDNDEILASNEKSAENTLDSNDDESNNINSSSSGKIKRIENPEVWLLNSHSKNSYIIDTISKYSNSNVKFHVMINSYFGKEYGGTATIKFNGNTYTGDIFDGKATIIAKTPSKPGSYKATLRYSGYKYVFETSEYTYNPSSSKFTLIVKKGPNTSVSAPKVTAYYKANKYFKVNVKNNGKAVKNLKLNVKVYTGSKYKNYVIKTNKNGVAKISTKKFKVGSHNVKITSKNSKYKVSKTSKIIIKKKSTSKYIIITTTAKMYNIVKKSGNFAVKTYIDDFTAGVRAPYKCIDIFLYKNGQQVKNTKYYTNYRIDGQWTGWVQYGLTSTAHHRYLVEDNANVEQIKVKVNKNVNSFY